jgi:hypothetical protein
MAEQRAHARQGKLEYNENGLTCNSYHRESPETIKDALNRATNSVHGASNVQPKRRRSWWEAQTRLYGFKPEKNTVAEFRETLASRNDHGTLQVTESMKKTEFQLKRSYEYFLNYS